VIRVTDARTDGYKDESVYRGTDRPDRVTDESRGDALRNDGLEEAAVDLGPVAVADAGQAGVIGQWLAQVAAEGVNAG
jgi:hypothetical protein